MNTHRRGDTRIESVSTPTVNLESKNPVGIAPTVCHGSAHGMARERKLCPRVQGPTVLLSFRGIPWHTVAYCGIQWALATGPRGIPWALATGPVGVWHGTPWALAIGPRDPVAYRGRYNNEFE